MLKELNEMIMQMRAYHKELAIYCGEEALLKLSEGSSYILVEDGDNIAKYLGADVFLVKEDEFKIDPNLVYVMAKEKPCLTHGMAKEKSFDLKEVSILGQRVLI
jgi:hypothetical protein